MAVDLYGQVMAPLHEQIAESLRRRISSGELRIGEPLPSEAQLREQWQGSRAPVRQALAALRAEGLIGGGPGKPPVVRRATLVQPFDEFLSFSRWVETRGDVPGARTLECALRRAEGEVADALGVEEGDFVVQVLRLRTINDVPTMIERSTFTADYGRALFSHDLDAGSVYSYLVAAGLEVGSARHVIDAVGADEQDAALLGLAIGAPLLRERRVAHAADGAAFECSDDRYRPDLVTFTIDNSVAGPASPQRTWGSPSSHHATASPPPAPPEPPEPRQDGSSDGLPAPLEELR